MKKKKKIIKVLLIIEYNLFFIPEFVAELLKYRPKEYFFKHVFLIQKVKTKQNINFNMIKNFNYLKFNEKIKFLLKVFIKLIEKILKPKKHNFKKIFEKNSIDVSEIKKPLSSYKKLIKSIKPDLIVNSATPYLNSEILEIPKYGCINRHSSMLPAGGGFFPIFYGVTYNEPLGTSVHFMSKNIDKGLPIIQKEIKLSKKNNSIFKLYEQSFKDSSYLIDKAIKLVIKNKKGKINKKIKPSYRSFPEKKDWNEFRKKKISWI